jgi:hypothetical protein
MSADIESELRDALLHTAGAMPDIDDSWERFTRQERTHRRSRRLRGGAAAGLLLVAVAVQTNLVPLPGWAPGIAVADTWSTFAHSPTRGNLAGDTAWLTSFRRNIQGIADPDSLWKVADRSAIRVVYAADVPGHRLALVLVPLRLGLITSSNLVWYDGPPGASGVQMEVQGNDDASEPVAMWSESSAETDGVAVVVAPTGTDVTISGSVTYDADGRVNHHGITTADGSGVGVAILPPSGVPPAVTARVTRGDTVIYAGAMPGSWSSNTDTGNQIPSDAVVAAAEQGARGLALDPAIFTSFIENALNDSRLTTDEVTIRLRWSGTINRQAAALFTVQPLGGGVLTYVYHGDTHGSRQDLRLLLPVAGAFQRPIAWRMRAEDKDAETDRVYVVVPTGTSATVTVGGSVVPVALDASGSGTTAVHPDRAAVVTSYAADGSVIASTPVPGFENDTSGIPGDTPLTRVVP